MIFLPRVKVVVAVLWQCSVFARHDGEWGDALELPFVLAFGLAVAFRVFAVAVAVIAAIFIGTAFHAGAIDKVLAVVGNIAVEGFHRAIGHQNQTIGTGFDQIGTERAGGF